MFSYRDFIFAGKALFFALVLMPTLVFAADLTNTQKGNHAMVIDQVFEKTRANNSWKSALATGKEAQVVIMSVSPATNPKNEIGMETHEFDQVILVISGNANAILDGKATPVKEGDMIFIPMGTAHNIVNLNKDKELKILSVYSGTDIPAGSNFKTMSDE